MKKENEDRRTIKGEVEGYSTKITRFPGKRGSRGLKIEGEWHNIIGSKDFLDLLPKSFPEGSFVVFAEKKNKKGFWDCIEGTLKAISKDEAYSKDIQDSIPTESKKKEEVKEEKIRELSQENINHYKEEVDTWDVQILEKMHEIKKLKFNLDNIEDSLKSAIRAEKQKILNARAMLVDLEYDLDNKVTFSGIKRKIKDHEKQIDRLKLNIKAREKEIAGFEARNRDERARARL